VIDERIALPKERALDQYVPWGHNGQLKLFSGQEAPGEGGRRSTVNGLRSGLNGSARKSWKRRRRRVL